jgi:hypothetical protein
MSKDWLLALEQGVGRRASGSARARSKQGRGRREEEEFLSIVCALWHVLCTSQIQKRVAPCGSTTIVTVFQ